MKQNKTKNYYFDMDGVLAQYERKAYEGDHPQWMEPGKHYFRSLPADKRIMQLIDSLHKACRYTDDHIFIITSIQTGPMFNEHMHDKILWLNEHFPYFQISDILIATTPKNDVAEYLHGRVLSHRDILVDDYNKNLAEWQNAGGISVKYLNGLNSPNNDFTMISNIQDTDYMFRVLTEL